MTLGINAIAPLIDGAPQISVSAWVNATSLNIGTVSNRIFSVFLNDTLPVIQLGINNTAKTFRMVANSDDQDASPGVNGTAQIIVGRWIHVGAVIDFAGGCIKMYFNGRPDGTGAATFDSTKFVSATPTTAPDWIGGGAASVASMTTANQFDGKICEPAVWAGDIGEKAFAELGNEARPVSPTLFPDKLKVYFPLAGMASPEPDLWSGKVGTITGTVGAFAGIDTYHVPPRAATRCFLGTYDNTYYVSASGNDTTGDGSSATPWSDCRKGNHSHRRSLAPMDGYRCGCRHV
jgi:hypothetical protein